MNRVVFYTAMGLSVTCKTGTEEDWGEYNKDPDWLMGLQCTMLKKSIKSFLRSLWKVESSFIFCSACGNEKFVRLYVTTVNFWCKLSEKLPGVKPWPNRLASRCKFWTCVQLAFRLATHLRRLATSCVDFGWAQIWTQVDASFYHLATRCKLTQVYYE